MSVYIFWVAKLCLSIIILVLFCFEKHLQFFNCLSFLFFEFCSELILLNQPTKGFLYEIFWCCLYFNIDLNFIIKAVVLKVDVLLFLYHLLICPRTFFQKWFLLIYRKTSKSKPAWKLNVTGLKMKEICILFLNYMNKWSP